MAFCGRKECGFKVIRPLSSTDPNQRYEALLDRFGSVDGELRMLRRCGGELARVLTGNQDPLQLLFPGGSFAEARQLYVESPYARTYNGALGEALQAAIATLPSSARLRVLEIGAGTGGTTTYVLPLLPADRVEYTFTDLSPLFLDRAAAQFAAYPFVRRAILDIEGDLASQGFRSRPIRHCHCGQRAARDGGFGSVDAACTQLACARRIAIPARGRSAGTLG